MPSSPPGIMTLTMAEALLVTEGAIEAAKKQGIKVSVAITDAGGRLVTFERMDGAPWSTVNAAQGKALVSAGFNISSGRLGGERGVGHFQLFGKQGDAMDMIYLQGAVAIFRNNVAIGACGVAGGTDAQAEACARSGIAKLVPSRA